MPGRVLQRGRPAPSHHFRPQAQSRIRSQLLYAAAQIPFCERDTRNRDVAERQNNFPAFRSAHRNARQRDVLSLHRDNEPLFEHSFHGRGPRHFRRRQASGFRRRRRARSAPRSEISAPRTAETQLCDGRGESAAGSVPRRRPAPLVFGQRVRLFGCDGVRNPPPCGA